MKLKKFGCSSLILCFFFSISGCFLKRLKKTAAQEVSPPPLFLAEVSSPAAKSEAFSVAPSTSAAGDSASPVAALRDEEGAGGASRGASPFFAPFYVDFESLIGRYLEALVQDPGLKEAYGGFYSKQNQPLNRVWSNFKGAVDRLGKLIALYPGAAIGMSAYQSVIAKENLVKKNISDEEKVAVSVQQDIHFAIEHVARSAGVQAVYDSGAARALYLNPEWDLTLRVLDALVGAKKRQLQTAATHPSAPSQ